MSPTKPIKRPLPKAVAAVELPVATETVATETVAEPSPAAATDAGDIANLNVKMDQVIDLMKAIDWKIWIYLKANNYID